MPDQDFVSLKELAKIIGLDRSNTRKYVLKLGIKPQKRRTPDSGNQLTLTITREEADAVIHHRAEQGFLARDRVVQGDVGVFYVIQLVPELDPRRVKLGFANDIAERLAQHRTAAPTARVVRTWPCKRAWEVAVMDALTAHDCRFIVNEVFEVDDLDALLRRGDAFFAALPSPDFRPDLSDYSPFRSTNSGPPSG